MVVIVPMLTVMLVVCVNALLRAAPLACILTTVADNAELDCRLAANKAATVALAVNLATICVTYGLS